ncbi:MAG: glycosyl hydrolase family 8, partial [Alphaproteobacteria bacterium]|nr:glycosyl hydrolase family 8 [Alphaproteobacteria bacterium]
MDRLRQQWGQFRSRFMAPDGRIIDTGNRNISHSEGQGWGMLMALAADDRASFERIWAWTRRTLDRPRDALSAWRFRPQAANPVEDMNNATDGDLFLAWALLEAGRIWGATEHTESGQAIGRDILRLLVRPAGGMALLLPGARGFERRDHVIVNPSYYCFPALRVLAAGVPDPAWLRVAGDGLSLLRAARFGRWGLPPDWLSVHKQDRRLTLPSNWAPRFSYDAVRVPLYLGWVGLGQEPALQAAADFWTDSGHPQMPAWTDLYSNAVSPYTASPGIAAVAVFAAQMAGRPIPVAERRAPDAMPDYYSGALSALVSLARRDSGADLW